MANKTGFGPLVKFLMDDGPVVDHTLPAVSLPKCDFCGETKYLCKQYSEWLICPECVDLAVQQMMERVV